MSTVSVSQDEKGYIMKMDGGDGCTLWMYLISLNCMFENGKDGKFYVFYHSLKIEGEKKKKQTLFGLA